MALCIRHGDLLWPPPNFGPFSNAVLVANNIKDGEDQRLPSIQGTGEFVGHLADGKRAGRSAIDQLWGIGSSAKAAGANGAPETNSFFYRRAE